MSVAGTNGLLHTNSSYVDSFKDDYFDLKSKQYSPDKLQSDFENAYNFALEQERSFYHSVFPNDNVNDYETFIQLLRDLFKKAGKDGEKIKRLANANLRNHMPTFSIDQSVQFKLTFIGEEYTLKLKEMIPSKEFQISGNGEIVIGVNKNTIKGLKNVVNSTLKQTRFDEESYSMDRFKQYLSNVVDKSIADISNNIIVARTSPKGGIVTENIDGITHFQVGEFPFNLSSTDLKKSLNEKEVGPELAKETRSKLDAAKDRIHDFIFNECLQVNSNPTEYNGRNLLKEAADMTWNSIMANDETFFFEGDNLTKSILGNMGEFQAQLLDTYIRLVTETSGNDRLGHIIASDLRVGAQLRSDYQLVTAVGGKVGVQVKNYNLEGKLEIDVNSDLGLISPYLGENFTENIVNTFFNESTHNKLGDLEGILEDLVDKFYWRAMNLNVGPGLDDMNTNTFYLVGGTNLVPASKILWFYKDSGLSKTLPTVSVSGIKYTKITDEQYELPTNKPKFIKYWTGEPGNWEATPQNEKEFMRYLIDTKIKTTLKLSALINTGSFELFPH